MRISVLHTTTYTYDVAVYQEPHTFRLRPRTDPAQNLLRYSIEITPPPAGQSWCLDQDGNVVLEAWFDGLMQALSVASSFEVETLRENPFDFILAEGEDGQPLQSALAPYLAGVPTGNAVCEFARQFSAGAGLPFLTDLNRALFEDFEHTIRDEGSPERPEATIASRSGTCRDLALLFCAACRARGIPARFVSGYEREAAWQDRSHMHAWAEVYLPGAGWRGFDPSQGLAVSTSHVVVAAAADPRLAAPVSGTFRGRARASMAYSIQMQASGT